jgi:hypothetical protein
MWQIQITPNGGHSNAKLLNNSIQIAVLDTCNITRLDQNSPVLTTNNYFLGVQMALTFFEIEPTYRSANPTGLNNLVSRSRASQSLAAYAGDLYDIGADAF